MSPSVMWFRRDLRLHDNPALSAARDAGGGEVVPLFVLDPALWRPAGDPRRAYLVRSLRCLDDSLDDSLDGGLRMRRGDPAEEVVRVARETGADTVHVSADFGPYGRRRDEAVEKALGEAGIQLVRSGSPYAINPGRLLSRQGTPYSVFTPFSRAWADLGWRRPAPHPRKVSWVGPESVDLPDEPDLGALELPTAGEAAARRRWREFRDTALDDYAARRDLPAEDGTSRLSHHLKWGEIHPRTILADLAGRRSNGARGYRQELAWREFYADVLFHHPQSARDYFRPGFAAMAYDDPDARLEAWREGQTGFPFVDAGMRQLQVEAWMHNRLRMVVASFLVKDLHVEWQHGARHFMRLLRDADLASNQHGWQWTAGSGTDAAPYVRVFNPVTQGLRYDPDGEYVRRYVRELRHLAGAAAHEPWRHGDGYAHDYPSRIVDHGAERVEALRRYDAVRRQ